MKHLIKFVCITLAFVMILAVPAQAAAEVSQRASNYFAAFSVYLHQTSSTQFQAWFEVTAVGGMDALGASTIKIQRSTDKSSWTTVATYEMDDYPSMVASNTSVHQGYVTYTFTRGYYYRAYVELYAKKGTGTAVYDTYTSYLDLR